jgi:5-hydroxyisourate hydrolase
MSAVSTHVLDTAVGVPAAGVAVALQQAGADGYRQIGQAVTDGDGRAADLGPARIAPGTYRLVFDTGAYFARQTSAEEVVPGQPGFFPEVVVTFRVDDSSSHCHTPLLLSPYGYTTYRGT